MRERHRSLFFPMLLIAAGVLWLLVNFGYIGAANLWALAHVWPIVLIGLGLGLILRSYWAEAGITISALLVIGLVAAVIYAPQLGWAEAPSWAWHWDWNVSGAIAGSKNVVTESRDLGDFSTISIQYPADVIVRSGASNSITIAADDNLMPQLSTETSGSQLVIRNEERNWSQRVNASETVTITITAVDLSRVNFDSAGSLTVESLTADSLEFHLNGAGSVTLNGLTANNVEVHLDGFGGVNLVSVDLGKLSLFMSGAGSTEASGSVDELVAHVDGLGSLNAKSLTAQTATVNVNGVGSATLRVERELSVDINGVGSVSYYGSPVLHQQTNGLGSVSKAGD